MTSKKALGDLRFDASMSHIDYKEANKKCDIIEKDLDKLFKLEDIEKELGVDLVKLLSAKSIFVVECDEIYESQTPFVDCVNKQILLAHYTTIAEDYDFKDYGKTWAFTREELEKS